MARNQTEKYKIQEYYVNHYNLLIKYGHFHTKKKKLEICPNPPKIWAISKLSIPTKTGDMQERTYDQNMAI
jgi:hypothetical protein